MLTRERERLVWRRDFQGGRMGIQSEVRHKEEDQGVREREGCQEGGRSRIRKGRKKVKEMEAITRRERERGRRVILKEGKRWCTVKSPWRGRQIREEGYGE